MQVNADDKLIKGTLRGNRGDADALVSRYYDEIYIYAYRQLGSKDDAMDMTQDIFISVIQTLNGYDRRKSSFRTWLYRVATNKIIDHRRKKRPVTVPLDDLELPNDFDKKLEQTAFISEIEDSLSAQDAEVQQIFRLYLYAGYTFSEIEDSLSAQDAEVQQIFRLYLYAGYTFSEIARMLGKPESTVKTQYYRLLTKLRKEFGDDENIHANPR